LGGVGQIRSRVSSHSAYSASVLAIESSRLRVQTSCVNPPRQTCQCAGGRCILTGRTKLAKSAIGSD
jgi:hypothetical protein